MLTRILWSRVLKIFVPPSFVQREQSVDRNIFINIRQCLSRYSYGKRSFNLKFNLNFDLHSHRFPIASSIELRVSFIIVLLSRPAISIVLLISYHWILDPSRDLARNGRTRKSRNATRGTVQRYKTKSAGKELIGCKGQFQFGASGTPGKWYHETGFIRAGFLSRYEHRRGSDDMSSSVVRMIEPARLQLSQEIAIFGASSNAAAWSRIR